MEKIKMIRSGRELVRVKTNEIVYLMADGDNCKLFLSTKKNAILLTGTFKHWVEVMSEYLITVKRGAAVSPSYINKVESDSVTILHKDNEVNLALSKNHIEGLYNCISIFC